jgi:PAS domain S-box-containing protein
MPDSPQSTLSRPAGYRISGALVFTAQLGLILSLAVQRLRRRRAESEAKEHADRYRSVVETQTELICRFRPDTTLTFVNDAFCRYWHTTREALLHSKFVDFVRPEAREPILSRIRHLTRGVDSHEYPVVRPDGTVGWQHWVTTAIVGRSGRVVELQAVGHDVTERRLAAETIAQLETHTSAILRAIPDLMFVMQRDGTYVDYHARDNRQLFAAPDRFLGRRVQDVMPAPLASMFMTAIERACLTGDTVVLEYEMPMRDHRQFEARIVQAGDDRVLSIVRDVTESKRAAALNRDLAGRLIASQEDERQRIARDLHDDLSQKLALLNIGIEQLAGQVNAPGQRAALHDLSIQAGEIAARVHNLSRELHPARLQTLGLVAAVESLCRETSQNRRISVRFVHGPLPHDIDPNVSLCLYRIAQEALHNVAQHSGAKEAEVRLTSEGDRLTLHVADPGVGFDPDALARSGLGLVSMRERVAFLKGQLVIHSAPGRGTRIGARVPLAPHAPVGVPVSQTA